MRKKVWTVMHDDFALGVKMRDKLRLELLMYRK